MAPSASMLFLSYHQLHRPTTTEARVLPRSREVEEAAPGGGGFRMSVRSALPFGLFQRRPEAVPAEGKAKAIVHERVAGEEIKTGAAAATTTAEGNKELERKFEEAVRLSCWSS